LTGLACLTILQSTILSRVQNVNIRPHSKLVRPHATLARVLSFLLLGFIVYGTTVEAAHKHGNIVELTNPDHGSSVSNPATGQTLNAGLSGCGDCLICQLHQHFSASLIVVRNGSAPPRTRLEISQATSRILKIRANAPRTGRAPPFTS
jgi:hypothetical protein